MGAWVGYRVWKGWHWAYSPYPVGSHPPRMLAKNQQASPAPGSQSLPSWPARSPKGQRGRGLLVATQGREDARSRKMKREAGEAWKRANQAPHLSGRAAPPARLAGSQGGPSCELPEAGCAPLPSISRPLTATASALQALGWLATSVSLQTCPASGWPRSCCRWTGWRMTPRTGRR